MLKPSGIVTLTTDFGAEGYFVGAVKGVMLNHNPEVKIVDITHSVPAGDILQAAFILSCCCKEYPRGTVHYCVVDPGVGSERKPLVVCNDDYFFVTPDNGVVYPVIKGKEFSAFDISAIKKSGGDISQTFNGRDVFAPAAARLSKGEDVEQLGRRVNDIEELEIPEPEPTDTGLSGMVIYIDHFGNIVSNFHCDDLSKFKNPRLIINDLRIDSNYEFYRQAPVGEPFYVDGSARFIEISVRDSRADRILGVRIGDKILLEGTPDD